MIPETIAEYRQRTYTREIEFPHAIVLELEALVSVDRDMLRVVKEARKSGVRLQPSSAFFAMCIKKGIITRDRDADLAQKGIRKALSTLISTNLQELAAAGYQTLAIGEEFNRHTFYSLTLDQVQLLGDVEASKKRLTISLSKLNPSHIDRKRHIENIIEKCHREIQNLAPEVPLLLQEAALPETAEQQKTYRKVLRALRNCNYISGRLEEKLTELVFDPPKLYTLDSPPLRQPSPAAPEVISPKAERKTLADERPAIIEYLMDPLRLSRADAEKYINALTLEELEDVHDRLILRVGEEYAVELLRFNPGILRYRQEGVWAQYLQTLKQVMNRVSHGSAEEAAKFGIESNLSTYARIDELQKLKRELYGTKISQDTPMETNEFNLHRYTLLHRGSTRVEQRLQDLIETGAITVKVSEHWTEDETGARHLNILKKIRRQLTEMFVECGYARPSFTLNFGQGTLTISEQDQRNLREIRGRAYALQRK